MKEFSVVPKICILDTCQEFVESFSLGDKDLVITSEFLYNTFLKKYNLASKFIFQELYGIGEPTDQMIEKMYDDIKGFEYNRVIAIGGGTIIDISKLFALEKIFPLVDLFDKKLEIKKNKKLLIVPTTCGTGSEVTNISIVNLLELGSKKGLAVPELFAEETALVFEFVKSLPPYVFATSSIDALIHAIESALSPKATEYSELFSYETIRKIIKAYRKIKAEGMDSRGKYIKNILIASNMAGIAFGNAGCAAVHAMSYPLGAKYHVAHGESNYAIFLGVMEHYYAKAPEGKLDKLQKELSNLLDCEEKNVYSELEQLLNYFIPRKKLSEYGVTEEELYEFTELVMTQQQRLMANNYILLNKVDVYNIYKSLY